MEGTSVTPGVTGVRWALSHAVNQEPDAECNREGDLAQILWRASKILVKTIKPNKFESNSHEGGTYAGRFAFENFQLYFTSCHLHSRKSFSLSQVKSKKAKQMKPKMMNPWHQLYQMIFSDDMTEVPDPCCPHFCLEKKRYTQKNQIFGWQDAPEPKRFGWLASLPCFAGNVFLRTEIEGTVLNKMLFFFGFTYHSQPRERMCWMDVSCSGASSNIRCRTGRAKQTFDPTQSAQFEAVLGPRAPFVSKAFFSCFN